MRTLRARLEPGSGVIEPVELRLSLSIQHAWDDVVVKPTISSRSWHTFRVSSRSNKPATTVNTYILRERSAQTSSAADYEEKFAEVVALRDVTVQPFLPAILTSGELSFVFLQGQLSHTIQKTVLNDGGWFAHELLGGANQLITPGPREQAWAENVYQHLVKHYGPLVFGRIDAIAGPQGNLLVSECELVIPRLFLREADAFDRYASAIATFLHTSTSRSRHAPHWILWGASKSFRGSIDTSIIH